MFHEQDRDTSVGDFGEQHTNLLDQKWRQALGRFVDQHQVGIAHQSAAHRQHLLLAARQHTGQIVLALGEIGKQSEHVRKRPSAELARALRLPSRLIGINNRNLKTLAVDLQTAERLAPLVDRGRLVVAESGLSHPADLARMARIGVSTFLIGESLMREADVAAATRRLLAQPDTIKRSA